MTKKVFFTEADVRNQIATMCRQMALQKYIPDAIVGITRGGLVPAVYLSHYFNAPLYTINVSFRDTKIQGGLHELDQLVDAGKKVLIVDDICDSGETLNFILDHLEEKYEFTSGSSTADVRFGVLFHNEASKCHVDPDFVGVEINKETEPCWIVFPWEQE